MPVKTSLEPCAMTIERVYELLEQGNLEEAYDGIRELYAHQKDLCTSWAMFWVGADMMKRRVIEGKLEEARKIQAALCRLKGRLDDDKGWAADAYNQCSKLLDEASRDLSAHADADHLRLGKWGEEVAAVFLRRQGYVIMARDWRSEHRDLDIIACDGDTYVFVEVKTRTSDTLVSPLAAIDEEKMDHLRRSINHYIKSRNILSPFRLDIITVVGPLGCNDPAIRHIKDVDIIKRLPSSYQRTNY